MYAVFDIFTTNQQLIIVLPLPQKTEKEKERNISKEKLEWVQRGFCV